MLLREEYFTRAIDDIIEHGGNDTLPFDVDSRFLAGSKEELVKIAFNFAKQLEENGHEFSLATLEAISFFSERLLTPAGPTGFRVTTKIHTFWNFYFNALGIAIAERLESKRSDRAHSYRYTKTGPGIFDTRWTWREFKKKTLEDCASAPASAIVIQTDISSFYEHVYHHRVENFIDELFPESKTISLQVDRMLNSFASGRSFGLPVGGQCSRILAELIMSKIDKRLTEEDVCWRRYVDDFVLIANDQNSAYKVLSTLSHALADYGLSLSKTKTSLLKVKHYHDYIVAQLGENETDPQANTLREIDLRFDPYSDTADEDYEQLKSAVRQLDIMRLIGGELGKTQPDGFIVTQISRTLKLLPPQTTEEVCRSLLESTNLHAFRASFSKIMRGIASVLEDESYAPIHSAIEVLLDNIPSHSAHLLSVDTNCLHYLRAIRSTSSVKRARFVSSTHAHSQVETIRRACVECWRSWKDRDRFIALRQKWTSLSAEEQRMLWLSASEFGDDGKFFRKQVRAQALASWTLGFEKGKSTFSSAYIKWCENEK
ncbi:hypothetical protein SRABI70_03461 [Pseudomonas sp. Bi70]|uniref:RNA-directed DNA polymerase n=1 Tax=Pseudomonas sp. Bi70 TaxID=2821127 RepID=UPI001D2944EB|nr:RNA-directed DNA polymerase [Pseudomonas sp. Bi70]CAH0270103.1 hypothetical protein SRABI70_03461 [Pseudomonas sp. Bi70]